jgi:hypothetical protein
LREIEEKEVLKDEMEVERRGREKGEGEFEERKKS